MTGLLVSVRSAEEALAALDGGAHVIDVKEPDRGPLGTADPRVWRDVRLAIGDDVPLSAALGELIRDARGGSVPAEAAHLDFAKVGLAECAGAADWPKRWQCLFDALPANVVPVAAAYADYEAAHAPHPLEVVAYAAHDRCGALLLDTYDKTSGPLTAHLAPAEIEALTHAARRAGMLVVLGGSLTPPIVPKLLPLAPDLLAVRGAVCAGGRSGKVDPRLVRRLAELLPDGGATVGRVRLARQASAHKQCARRAV